MTDTLAKRASTPRKTSRPAGNGQPVRPPEPAPPLHPPTDPVVREAASPPPEATAHHPYGDRDIFTWQPADGSEPIILPHFSTVNVTQEFFCRIYEKIPMVQNLEFMILAGVPMDIRLQVSRLGDNYPAEQNELFRTWYSAVTQPAGGELPGES